mgnify:CR=1 FL=1
MRSRAMNASFILLSKSAVREKRAYVEDGIAKLFWFDDWCKRDPEYAALVEVAKGSRLMRHFGTVTKAAQAGDWRASVWLCGQASHT